MPTHRNSSSCDSSTQSTPMGGGGAARRRRGGTPRSESEQLEMLQQRLARNTPSPAKAKANAAVGAVPLPVGKPKVKSSPLTTLGKQSPERENSTVHNVEPYREPPPPRHRRSNSHPPPGSPSSAGSSSWTSDWSAAEKGDGNGFSSTTPSPRNNSRFMCGQPPTTPCSSDICAVTRQVTPPTSDRPPRPPPPDRLYSPMVSSSHKTTPPSIEDCSTGSTDSSSSDNESLASFRTRRTVRRGTSSRVFRDSTRSSSTSSTSSLASSASSIRSTSLAGRAGSLSRSLFSSHRRGSSSSSPATSSSVGGSYNPYHKRRQEKSVNIHKVINVIFATTGLFWVLFTIAIPGIFVSTTVHTEAGGADNDSVDSEDGPELRIGYSWEGNREGDVEGDGGDRAEKRTLPRTMYVQFEDGTMHTSIHPPRKATQRRTMFNNRPFPKLYSSRNGEEGRKIELYPAEFSDNTQFYGVLDSSDEKLAGMEMRQPYVKEDCVPMQTWQTTFNPTCNPLHERDMVSVEDIQVLFGTKGFWRDAWRMEYDVLSKDGSQMIMEKAVLKTNKIHHRFEDDFYEHNRIDAVAMERLTPSPHVMDIYGYCGQSVITEFADGPRIGTRADKAKGLDKLRMARDLASGLADLHSIDGENNATFAHFDVNLANMVIANNTIKLNDFNIGIMLRWNTTSHRQCGFPAKYPNPQWRSPEEARDSQNLTEKVDVYSMGNVFFRLICGHEPWNKLEPGGRPEKEEVHEKVQRGVLPFVPDRVRNSTDYVTVAIREAMMKCYTFDPAKRPNARTIANTLDQALNVAEKSKQMNKVVQQSAALSPEMKIALNVLVEEGKVRVKVNKSSTSHHRHHHESGVHKHVVAKREPSKTEPKKDRHAILRKEAHGEHAPQSTKAPGKHTIKTDPHSEHTSHRKK